MTDFTTRDADYFVRGIVRVPMTKQCPGDGDRACLTTIPANRQRCHFCTKTVRLREQGR